MSTEIVNDFAPASGRKIVGKKRFTIYRDISAGLKRSD